jgi:hypothetical protein
MSEKNKLMTVWFNSDPAYDCIFVMWSGATRWHGETEFIDEHVIAKITLRKGASPESLGWIYLGEL